MSFGLFVHDFDVKGKLFDGDTSVANNALASKKYVLDAVAAGGGDWLASVASEISEAPSSSSDGDRHLVGSSPSGWPTSGNKAHDDLTGSDVTIAAGQVVEYDATNTRWIIYAPSLGSHVFVEGGSTNAGNALIYTSSGWVVTANATGALVASNNLSDLPSAATARSNLELGDLAVQDNVDLASDVTGQLPVANGGTGASSASDARSNLGLGSIATQAADSVTITGGSVTGITDITVADGGTGASTASGARTNLGVAIGSDVQAHSSQLDTLAAVDSSDGNFLVGSASGFVAESGATARASLGLGSAAVVDTGVSEDNVVAAADDLNSDQLVEVKLVETTTLTFSNPGSNWNYVYAGSTWEGPYSSTGTITSKSGDSTSGTLVIRYTSGSSSSWNTSGSDTISISGYSFTTASASTTSATGLSSVSQSNLKSKVGNAFTALSASTASSSKGIAAFDSATFSSNSGFISLNTGISAGNIAKIVAGVSAGDLVKVASLTAISSGSLISSNAIDTTAKTLKTQTDVSGVVAGQVLSSSGYDFPIVSVSSDGESTPTYTITVTDDSSYLQYLYDGSSFDIAGGDGFVSGGAIGNAANLDVATGVGSSAQSKVLKVSASASLSADSLLAINSSGEIIAGSAGEQGTVTSIALADDSSNASSAVTTSGTISVLGGGSNGAISTAINGSSALEVSVADASTSAAGVVSLASSSSYSGGTHVPGVAFSTGADLGADKFITLNSSAQIATFVPDHYDIDGPIVKSCSGISGSVSMPSTVGALEGAYVIHDTSASSDVSVSLPTSTSSSEIGATVTFKLQELNGQKVRISGGTVAGGARMLIDGADYVDLDQPRQSVTLHLGAVLGSSGQSTDALCWSII